jgi:nucleolar protein 15
MRYTAGFFSQFGDVKHVKVSRSKKTGNAKHFAFLEFKSPEVCTALLMLIGKQ